MMNALYQGLFPFDTEPRENIQGSLVHLNGLQSQKDCKFYSTATSRSCNWDRWPITSMSWARNENNWPLFGSKCSFLDLLKDVVSSETICIDSSTMDVPHVLLSIAFQERYSRPLVNDLSHIRYRLTVKHLHSRRGIPSASSLHYNRRGTGSRCTSHRSQLNVM